MFKVTNNLCPEMIQNHFSKRCSSKSKATYERPNINKVYKGEYSLRWFGPIVWDSMIPEKTKSLSNFEEFKKAINAWVPNNCPCRLCKHYIPNLGFVALFE